MPHMKPEVVNRDWWKVETRNGISWVPYDVVPIGPATPMKTRLKALRDYVEGPERDMERATYHREMWGARLSAPGYMDQTEWAVFKRKSDARKYLYETYNVCPDCGVDVSERECPDGHAWDMPAAREE